MKDCRIALLSGDIEAGIPYPSNYSSSIDVNGKSKAYNQFKLNLESIIKPVRDQMNSSVEEPILLTIAGDLLAGYIKPEHFYNSYRELFTYLENLGLRHNLETVFVLGNHDEPLDDFKCNADKYFNGLENIHWVGDKGYVKTPKTSLVVCGVDDAPYSEEERNTHYKSLNKHWQSEIKKYKKTIEQVVDDKQLIDILLFHRARKNTNFKTRIMGEVNNLIRDLQEHCCFNADVLIDTGHYHNKASKSIATDITFNLNGNTFNLITPAYKTIVPYNIKNRRIIEKLFLPCISNN